MTQIPWPICPNWQIDDSFSDFFTAKSQEAKKKKKTEMEKQNKNSQNHDP